jgi:2'-5' RNA ligase
VPRSALIVVVPEAEPVVGEWRLRYDNARLGIPAHITLLFPFVPAEELDEALFDDLRELFAAQPRFTFSLTGLAEFRDQTVWLTPEPPEPFRALTDLIFDRFRAYPPYQGIHDEVIPHLTVTSGDASFRDEVDKAVAPQLPIEAEVHDVVLLEEDASGYWHTRERFLLGG